MADPEPIHVTVPGSPDDPRAELASPAGVVIHRCPPLHPDDIVLGPGGIRITSVSRTLIDLAEVMDVDELRECFENARRRGLLDLEALAAARGRVEWRPSLPMLDAVIAEFA